MNDAGGLEVLIASLFMLFLFVIAVALPLFCALWAMSDAERRGKSGCLVAILVFFFFPVGIILWLIFRPSDRL